MKNRPNLPAPAAAGTVLVVSGLLLIYLIANGMTDTVSAIPGSAPLSPPRHSQGYFLTAFGSVYNERLIKFSIPSIRCFGDSRPITVLTDDPERYNNISDVNTMVFDDEVYRRLFPGAPIPQWHDSAYNWGFASKLAMFDLSPYEETIFFDSDVVPARNITKYWLRCQAEDKLVVVSGYADDNNLGPDHWHWGTLHEVSAAVGVPLPMLSSGVVYFKRNTQFTQTVLPYWVNYQRYKIKNQYGPGLLPDEIYISVYLGLNKIHPIPAEGVQMFPSDFVPTGDYWFVHLFSKDDGTLKKYVDRTKEKFCPNYID
jgi:hypothetical protein